MIKFFQENTTIIKIIFALILICLVVGAIFIAKKLEPTKTKSEKIKKYATIAIFASISIILYFIQIPFPVFTFLKIQLSSLPAFIIGFLLGPSSGLMVIFLRTAICLPFTKTLCVGEIADLLIGVSTTLVLSITYMRNKTKKQALLSLIYAAITWVVMAVILNYILLLPFYMQLYFNESPATFIQAFGLDSKISFINENNYMLVYTLIGVVPFNILLASICAIITFIIYKRISKSYHKIASSEEEKIDK